MLSKVVRKRRKYLPISFRFHIHVTESMINTYRKKFIQLRVSLICTLLVFLSSGASAQKSSINDFLTPADTLNKLRLNSSIVFSSLTYSTFSIGLYNVWYKQYDQGPFQLYNDYGEWRHIDKMGHMYTSYFQGVLCYQGAKWTGLSNRQSIWTGFMLGTLFQSTIEVMDGFSQKWGFSTYDVAMNFVGSGAFVAQQVFWEEQRIRLKVSNIPRPYSTSPISSVDGQANSSLRRRANNLFGTSYAEKFLKDYNSLVTWASVDLHAFFPNSPIPPWLNISLGYGAGNMFGGYENIWNEGASQFRLTDEKYRRYSSFYLAPDIDLSHIRTKYQLINTLLDVANIFKLPLPAIEYNTLGEFHFHWVI